jgi:hypothetical protein
MHKPFTQQFSDYYKQNRDAVFVWKAHMDDAEEKKRADRVLSAWLVYLEERGHYATLRTWKFIADGGGRALTFPCEEPEIFDITYTRSERPAARYEERAPNPDRVARKQIADKVPEAAPSTRPPRDKRCSDYEVEAARPQTAKELGEEFQREKPPISDSLRAKIALPPKDQEVAA